MNECDLFKWKINMTTYEFFHILLDDDVKMYRLEDGVIYKYTKGNCRILADYFCFYLDHGTLARVAFMYCDYNKYWFLNENKVMALGLEIVEAF